MLTAKLVESLLGIPNMMTKEDLLPLLGGAPQELVDAVVELAKPAPVFPTESITTQHLAYGVAGIPQSAFATLGYLVDVKDGDLKRPKSTPFRNGNLSGRFQKMGVSQVILNPNYARMVNNRMAKQCEPGEGIEEKYGAAFEPAPRQWGERVFIAGRAVGLVEHKGNLYLETAVLRHLGKVYYFCDGKPIEWEEIKDYFHPKRESKRQPLPESFKVKWRTWGLDSIHTVAITPNRPPRETHRYAIEH